MGDEITKPTGRELEIIQVLWAEEPCTVREILNKMNEGRDEPFAYTTILRFLQIMTEKGLVVRDSEAKTHVYRTSEPASKTKRFLARDLIDRVFSGSPRDLVVHLLGSEPTSAKDFEEIREALRELEEAGDDS